MNSIRNSKRRTKSPFFMSVLGMIQIQLKICLPKIFVVKCSEPQVITIKETGLVNCSGSLTGNVVQHF